MKSLAPLVLTALTIIACNNKAEEKTAEAVTPEPVATPAPTLPDLPASVVLRTWEMGDPQNMKLISDVYQAWDSQNYENMAAFFADSTAYDLPGATRLTTTSKDVAAKLHKWRTLFGKTANIPFSLMSLHNKERNQDWVIAWTWNKWEDKYGKKDSMLYCDNWRIQNGKIVYLNSLEQRPSKQLTKTLNALPE